MSLFKKKPTVPAALRGQIDALRADSENVATAQDALDVAQRSAQITEQLLKSIDAQTGEAPAYDFDAAQIAADAIDNSDLSKAVTRGRPAPKPPIENDSDADSDSYDPDAEGFDPESVDDGGDEFDGDEEDEPDDGPEGDDPDAMPERNAPERMPAPKSRAVKGPVKGGMLAKSLDAIAQGDPHTARAMAPVFGAIEIAQEEAGVTNDYLEQMGALLTKSLEGLALVSSNQHEIAARLEAMEEKIDERAARAEGLERANYETLSKSVESVVGYVNSQRQAPVGTPIGRAIPAPGSVSSPTLSGAVPVAQAASESHLGWNRTDLKKSIEGAIRSGEFAGEGLTVSHFTAITDGTPLDELPAMLYEVASKVSGKPLPVAAAPAALGFFEPGLG